ncbi:hypothetical protein QWY77_11830 [Thalassotalea ponticola]|uniref:hypothetical protein n=1 Tax=Thalassotalea ponticola TaxID=1523392 RepID=UPI0025B2F628|nr:hypothetical protein [Thalassotalea ponticola]MDN3653432.1 hypothetical protein [Thalassotalea ponticola]
MNYNPNELRQDKLTTKILVEHALTQIKSQQILAFELNVPESRISEAKQGKHGFKTETAEILIAKYGLPQSAFGEYKADCIYLDQHSNIEGFLSQENDLQLSILIDLYIQKMKLHLFPEREGQLDVTIEDVKVNDLLSDKHFIELATLAVEQFYEGADYEEQTFRLQSNSLRKLTTPSGDHNLPSLLERYSLESELSESQDSLSNLLYAAYAINECNKRKHTQVVKWNKTADLFQDVRSKTELNVTGRKIVADEWLDVKVDVFARNNVRNKTIDTVLTDIVNNLDRLTPSILGFNEPLNSINEKLSIKLKSLDVFYKEDSTFTVILGVEHSEKINPHVKLSDYNLVLHGITPDEMLHSVTPQLLNLPTSSYVLDFAWSEFQAKAFFAKNGIMIPGAIVI